MQTSSCKFLLLPGYDFCFNKNRGHPQSLGVFCNLGFFMPDAKRDNAQMLMSSKPLTCDIVSSLSSTILHPSGYASKTGPAVTIDVKNKEGILIVM